MNIKHDPNQPVDTGNYKRDVIWDYEDKVDAEKERWRKLAKRDRVKLREARAAYYALHPEVNVRNGKNLAKHAPLKRIQQERNMTQALAEAAGCKINTSIPSEKLAKCRVYFEKLIENRDKIKRERR